ncbi:hypothetical protein BISA_1360 [Bifidobacterium saguini DSM 23967]|uniref:Uncharacterized protein n=1 Tax=Bifidobacterium saguini DSM 23967 TaxID=1437607 RepID=A0A087DCE5_9BIFI|nr:HTH domain-containing protein [Bifidobacterium saguini]KFI93195.1 hypothetical protein BISA_1360 [Bifidobacterium saguini DSM 23967]
MNGGSFTERQMAWLSQLAAVRRVSRTRIYYTEEFKQATIRRYRNGEHPVDIFREAGLDPAVIGHKRIERCINRWKDEPILPPTTIDDNPITPRNAFQESQPTPGKAWDLLIDNERRLDRIEARILEIEKKIEDGSRP